MTRTRPGAVAAVAALLAFALVAAPAMTAPALADDPPPTEQTAQQIDAPTEPGPSAPGLEPCGADVDISWGGPQPVNSADGAFGRIPLCWGGNTRGFPLPTTDATVRFVPWGPSDPSYLISSAPFRTTWNLPTCPLFGAGGGEYQGGQIDCLQGWSFTQFIVPTTDPIVGWHSNDCGQAYSGSLPSWGMLKTDCGTTLASIVGNSPPVGSTMLVQFRAAMFRFVWDPRDGDNGVYIREDVPPLWYNVPVRVVGGVTASFTAVPDTSEPGATRFTSTSTDADGEALTATWNFGDGTTDTGTPVQHRYAKPGEYTVTLTARNVTGLTDAASSTVTVAAPTLSASVELLGGAAPPLDEDVVVTARVRIAAGTDGVGALSAIRFTGAPLRISPSDAFEVLESPQVTEPFRLDPGGEVTFDYRLKAVGQGTYDLATSVTGTDASGTKVEADGDAPGEIGQPFPVEVSFTKDGEAIPDDELKLDEDPETGEPIATTVTVITSITNDTDAPLTGVTVQPMDLAAADPQHPIEPFPATVVGANADLVVPDIAVGATVKVERQLKLTGEGSIVAKSLVASDQGIAIGRHTLHIGVQTLLEYEISSEPEISVVAGAPVTIHGTITNKTVDRKIALTDPVRVLTTGNLLGGGFIQAAAGDELFADFPSPLTGILEPGESVPFQVRFNTQRPTVEDYDGHTEDREELTEGAINFNLAARAAIEEEDGTWSALASEPVTVYSSYPGSVRISGGEGGVVRVHVDTSRLSEADTFSRTIVAGFGLTLGALEGAQTRASGVFNTAYNFTTDPAFRDKTFAEAFEDAQSQAALQLLGDVAVYLPQAQMDQLVDELSVEIVDSLTEFNASVADGRWREPTPSQQAVRDTIEAYVTHLQGAWGRGDPTELAEAVQPIGNIVGETGSDILMTELAFQGLVRLAMSPRYFTAAVASWRDNRTIAQMKANLPSAAQQAIELNAIELSKSKYPLLEEAFDARRPLTDVDLGVGTNKDGAGLAMQTVEKAREWSAANPNRTIVIIPNEANVAAMRDLGEAVGKIENIKSKSMAEIEHLVFGGRAEDVNIVLLRKFEYTTAEVDALVDEQIALGTLAPEDRAVARQIAEKRKKEWALFVNRGNVVKDAASGTYVPDIDPATGRIKPDPLGIGNLKAYDEAGRIPNQFRGADNGLELAGPKQTPEFTLDYLDAEYKPTTPENASYVVPRQEDPITGRLLKITGDDDGIFMGLLNGLGLSKNEIEGAYESVMDVFNHPFSDTWLAAVDKKLEIFSRYFETVPGTQTRGAPLVMFANGEAYAVKINPWTTRFDTAVNRAFVDFVGAPRAVDPLAQATVFQSIALNPVRQLLLPVNFIRMLLKLPNAALSGRKVAMTSDGVVVRLTADGSLETWTAASGWRRDDAAAAAFAAGALGLAPQSYLKSSTPAGATSLEIASAGDLDAEGAWFQPGDRVVIDPGGPNEETVTVAFIGSLHFAAGLANAHAPGELVASLGPADGGTTPTEPGDPGGGSPGGGSGAPGGSDGSGSAGSSSSGAATSDGLATSGTDAMSAWLVALALLALGAALRARRAHAHAGARARPRARS